MCTWALQLWQVSGFAGRCCCSCLLRELIGTAASEAIHSAHVWLRPPIPLHPQTIEQEIEACLSRFSSEEERERAAAVVAKVCLKPTFELISAALQKVGGGAGPTPGWESNAQAGPAAGLPDKRGCACA